MKTKITLEQAVNDLLEEGYSDILVDACGLWKRQPDIIKEKLLKKYIGYVDRKYTDDKSIAYIEMEDHRAVRIYNTDTFGNPRRAERYSERLSSPARKESGLCRSSLYFPEIQGKDKRGRSR